jgi:putative tryptophan/tyrosine transport system substrate-binding protein
MPESFSDMKKKGIIWVLAVVISLFLISLTGCTTHEKIFTIGVVSNVALETPVWLGFNSGMTERGYIEGKNLKYIIKNVPENNEQNIDNAIKELLNQNIDLILTLGKEVDLRAKELVKGTDMPVLFGSGPWPAEIGLVQSLNHPGGNLTGVQGVDCVPKALELLKVIIPDLKRVYLPYNPDDVVSTDYLPGLNKAASQLGIELVFHKIHSVEEVVTAIKIRADDLAAVFMIPSPTLNNRNSELSRAAIEQGIPMGAGLLLDKDVLITYTNDFFDDGKKLARLAREIINGKKPVDIPVETAEVKLVINLKTAEKIGVHIPDSVLAQASTIIR